MTHRSASSPLACPRDSSPHRARRPGPGSRATARPPPSAPPTTPASRRPPLSQRRTRPPRSRVGMARPPPGRIRRIAPPITRKFRPEAPKNGLSNRSVGEKRESVPMRTIEFRCRPVSKTSRFGRLESRFSTIHRANGAVSFFFTIENQTRARREARSVSVYRGGGFDLRYGSFSAAAAIIRTRDYSVPTSAFFYT